VKHDEPDALLRRQVEADGVLSVDLERRLTAFAALLTRWNPTIRLISSQAVDHLWARHIDDALQLVPHMPSNVTHAIDLGSGGGFPGLILALATGVHFDLVESDSRKAAFLVEAATLTKAPATIHATRIEDLALESRMLVTARALAPLPKLLELSQPLLADGGVCLFPKGERAETEIIEARKGWIMDLQQMPSRTAPMGQILRISNLRRREVTL